MGPDLMTSLTTVMGSVWTTILLVAALIFFGLFRGSPKLLRSMLELIQLLVRIKRQTKRVTSAAAKRKGWSVVDMFAEAVARNGPDQPMIVMADSGAVVTYADMDARSNRVAQWLVQAKGFTPGATVALLMPNCIDYVAVWIGVAKAGGVTALLNTNLTGAPLVHAIKTALAPPASSSSASSSSAAAADGSGAARKLLITTAALAEASLRPDTRTALEQDIGADVFEVVQLDALSGSSSSTSTSTSGSSSKGGSSGSGSGSALTDSGALGSFSTAPVASSLRAEAQALSTLFYIYTSGTTGLPKASKINHLRFWSAGATLWTLCRLTPADRLYSALPLYHASGGMMGVSACVLSGATMVLRPKFSVSLFSRDLTEHRCTAVQYIGELCRYLVAAKPNPLDGSQRIKCAAGNGLRPEV
jgi:fatty-acyl-CoA synthase